MTDCPERDPHFRNEKRRLLERGEVAAPRRRFGKDVAGGPPDGEHDERALRPYRLKVS